MVIRRLVTTGASIACWLTFASIVDAQTFSRDPLTNYLMRRSLGVPGIADQAHALVRRFVELKELESDLVARLNVTRREFWATYPDKPGFAEKRAAFAEALKDKDQIYELYALQGYTRPALSTSDGHIDGGISPGAYAAFDAWMAAVRGHLNLPQNMAQLLGNPRAVRDLMAKAEPEHQAYLLRRDLEEFRKAGQTPSTLPRDVWELGILGVAAGQSDPYRQALEATENGTSAASRCSNVLGATLGQVPATACTCVRTAFRATVDSKQLWDVEANFTSDVFLLTAVSKVGLREQVAACVK